MGETPCDCRVLGCGGRASAQTCCAPSNSAIPSICPRKRRNFGQHLEESPYFLSFSGQNRITCSTSPPGRTTICTKWPCLNVSPLPRARPEIVSPENRTASSNQVGICRYLRSGIHCKRKESTGLRFKHIRRFWGGVSSDSIRHYGPTSYAWP